MDRKIKPVEIYRMKKKYDKFVAKHHTNREQSEIEYHDILNLLTLVVKEKILLDAYLYVEYKGKFRRQKRFNDQNDEMLLGFRVESFTSHSTNSFTLAGTLYQGWMDVNGMWNIDTKIPVYQYQWKLGGAKAKLDNGYLDVKLRPVLSQEFYYRD